MYLIKVYATITEEREIKRQMDDYGYSIVTDENDNPVFETAQKVAIKGYRCNNWLSRPHEIKMMNGYIGTVGDSIQFFNFYANDETSAIETINKLFNEVK